MSRTKKESQTFDVGDKVKLTSNSKSEGVVVHRHSVAKDTREWSVHWYNIKPDRGVYRADEIKKYY